MKNLISLLDISQWNTNNIKNMSFMLYNCSSITLLPDISKWNFDNISNINNIFDGCSSLILIP